MDFFQAVAFLQFSCYSYLLYFRNGIQILFLVNFFLVSLTLSTLLVSIVYSLNKSSKLVG